MTGSLILAVLFCFRRASVWVWILRSSLSACGPVARSQAIAHWGETVQMHHMLQVVWSQCVHETTHVDPHWREKVLSFIIVIIVNITIIIIVTVIVSHSVMARSYCITWGFTLYSRCVQFWLLHVFVQIPCNTMQWGCCTTNSRTSNSRWSALAMQCHSYLSSWKYNPKPNTNAWCSI